MPETTTARKWTAKDLGPRQAKQFNEAISKFGWEAKTICELLDGGHKYYVTPMIGGGWTETAKQLMAEITTKYDFTVTGENYRLIVADLEAALPKLRETCRVVDRRTTPEQRAERERAALEREEKQRVEAERVAKMVQHHYDLPETAAAVKSVLATLWPSVKFSVKSERYSGGRAIRANWTDGPTERQVRAVMDVFQDTHFDGMNDLETHSGPEEWNGHRFHFQSGYCSQSRQVSADFLRSLAARFAEETKLPAPAIDEKSPGMPFVERGDRCGFSYFAPDAEHPAGILCHDDVANWTAADLIHQMGAYAGMVPAHPVDTGDRYADQANYAQAQDTVFKILLGEIKPAAPAAESTPIMTQDGITVSENDAKDGVEIRFKQKPDRATLDTLKAHGWRWSKFSACWYARRTPEKIAFAHRIAGSAAVEDDGLKTMTDVDRMYEDQCADAVR